MCSEFDRGDRGKRDYHPRLREERFVLRVDSQRPAGLDEYQAYHGVVRPDREGHRGDAEALPHLQHLQPELRVQRGARRADSNGARHVACEGVEAREGHAESGVVPRMWALHLHEVHGHARGRAEERGGQDAVLRALPDLEQARAGEHGGIQGDVERPSGRVGARSGRHSVE